MFLIIEKEKVQYTVPMLNGEAILIKLDAISITDGFIDTGDVNYPTKVMNITVSMFSENDFLINGDRAHHGHIVGHKNSFSFNLIREIDLEGNTLKEVKAYSTVAVEFIKEDLKNKFSLVDADITVKSSTTWDADIATYPVRITFPTDELVTTYGAFIAAEVGKPKTKTLDGYTLYVLQILPEHDFIRLDPNLLIEEL